MKVLFLAVAFFGLLAASVSAQESCLDPDRLVRLDGQWEHAFLESDAHRLATL